MQLPAGATLQFLTESDKKKLNEIQQDGSVGCLMTAGILLMLGPPIAGFSASAPLGLGLSLVFLPVGGWMLYTVTRHQKGINQDIADGKKVVLRAVLAGKRDVHTKHSMNYYLQVGDKDFKTDVTTFVRSEIGQLIEVHYAPYSEITLKVDLAIDQPIKK